MTKKEAAQYLGIAQSTLDKLRKKRKIKHIKDKGFIRFRKEWLDEYAESSIVETAKEKS